MSNTDIKANDIREWGEKFTNAMQVVEHLTERTEGDKEYVQEALSDALFLVAYVESQLKIKVIDDVYQRARAMQKTARELLK